MHERIQECTRQGMQGQDQEHETECEGRCETVHEEKHKKPSVSEQEMEHSKHKHAQKSTNRLMRKQQHLNIINLPDDRCLEKIISKIILLILHN